jgi:lipoate---protein ligase
MLWVFPRGRQPAGHEIQHPKITSISARMKLLDLTCPTPAENLALDEALLDLAESGAGDEVLRFWESPDPFVVLGYSNAVEREVDVAACARQQIPILRRCTGGGTVLQGPGCLNYALVLKITGDGPARNISAANQFIMERNRAALDTLLLGGSRRQQAQTSQSSTDQSPLRSAAGRVEIRGHTDLAVAGRKCSGNSQRRRKRYLLFHGTFLLQFDLRRVGDFLRLPSRQPDYRASRSHTDFLLNLGLDAAAVRRALAEAWKATAGTMQAPTALLSGLVAAKYGTRAWNLKF